MPRVNAFLSVRVAGSTDWNVPTGKPPAVTESATADAVEDEGADVVEGEDVVVVDFDGDEVVDSVDVDTVDAADDDDEAEGEAASGLGASPVLLGGCRHHAHHHRCCEEATGGHRGGGCRWSATSCHSHARLDCLRRRD